MGKTLKCSDVGVNCDFEIHGQTEQEILAKAREHAAGCHQGTQMTPELVQQLKAAIKDAPGDHGCCGGH